MTYFSGIVKFEGENTNFSSGFLRGGNWNNGANTGSFTLNLNNTPSNTNTNIGFRCTSDQNRKDRLVKNSLHQNGRHTSKDICPGFRRSQCSFRFKGKLWENIMPVFLCSCTLQRYKVNRKTIALVRDIMSPFQKERAH